MNPEIQIVSIAGSLVVMAFVFQLIRTRRLREEYAILWFLASLGLIVVSLWRGSLDLAARLLGVAYPPSVLLLAATFLGFVAAIHFSMSLSQLEEQNTRLAQELALLRHRLDAATPAPSRQTARP
jgi:hypothetical protein